MEHQELSNREKFVQQQFKLSFDDILILREVSNKIGTNKYTSWLARELKNGIDLISNINELVKISKMIELDGLDIMKFDFFVWLEKLKEKNEIISSSVEINKLIEDGEIFKERVIFISSDSEYFFYILNVGDLDYESEWMEHCVGEQPIYATRIKTKKSLIVSLRNKKNIPYATIEIDLEKGIVLQIQGRKNQPLNNKLNKVMVEFVLYVSDFQEIDNKEVLDIINDNLNFFDKK